MVRGEMVPADGGQQRRAFEYEAYQALWLSSAHPPAIHGPAIGNWDSACELLQTYYTVGQARQHIRGLRDADPLPRRVAEPAPQLALNSVTAPPVRGHPRCAAAAGPGSLRLSLGPRPEHPQREQHRPPGVGADRALYAAMRAAEARAEAAAGAGPPTGSGSRAGGRKVLSWKPISTISTACRIRSTVQNARIESRGVRALTGLLTGRIGKSAGRVGLLIRGASYRAGDAARSRGPRGGSVLASLPVPCGISPVATVAFAAESRELAVEYQLPTVDVIPAVEAYRYDDEREAVGAMQRPASQVKALYTNTIAQLTLLSLAAILALGIEHHIEVVVFNGVVDALDPGSGNPIRPCLVTVRVTADAFAELDLANLDPSACLDRLSATVSAEPGGVGPRATLPE